VRARPPAPRPTTQARAQAIQLFQLGMIHAQAALEVLQFPNWQSVIRRMSQQGIDQALQVLQQAGMPPESCVAIKQAMLSLMQQPLMTDDEAAGMVNAAGDEHFAPGGPAASGPGGPGQPPQAAPGAPQAQRPMRGAAPTPGSPGGAVGAPGQAGAPAQPGIPKAFQGMGQ